MILIRAENNQRGLFMGYSSGRDLLDVYVDRSKNAEQYNKRNKVRKIYRIINTVLYLAFVALVFLGIIFFLWWLGRS